MVFDGETVKVYGVDVFFVWEWIGVVVDRYGVIGIVVSGRWFVWFLSIILCVWSWIG